jgi:surface protein
MEDMFGGCAVFNADLSGWDVSRVKDMKDMFKDCAAFNADLSGWNVSRVEDMTDMFKGTPTLLTKPAWYTGDGPGLF